MKSARLKGGGLNLTYRNQIVEEALRVGPQVITANGEETAVVLSIEEYRRRFSRISGEHNILFLTIA
jgi:hypothetical protein